MIRFAKVFPNRSIVHSLSGQLGWTHFRTIIYIGDPLAREFSTEMCRPGRWSVRVLQEKIRGMLFERTALSRKPEELARKELEALRDEDMMTPDLVFRSLYLLDFLGLPDSFSEKDLENSILRELERGTGLVCGGGQVEGRRGSTAVPKLLAMSGGMNFLFHPP